MIAEPARTAVSPAPLRCAWRHGGGCEEAGGAGGGAGGDGRVRKGQAMRHTEVDGVVLPVFRERRPARVARPTAAAPAAD
jgi:hypothetical protein